MLLIGLLEREWRKRRAELDARLGRETVVTLGGDRGSAWGWPGGEVEVAPVRARVASGRARG